MALIKRNKLEPVQDLEPSPQISPDFKIVEPEESYESNGHYDMSEVQSRADEAWAEQEKIIAEKTQAADQEIEQRLQDAEAQANQIMNQAEQELLKTQEDIEKAYANLEQQKQVAADAAAAEKQKAFDEGMNQAKVHIDELMMHLATFHDAKRICLEDAKQDIAALAMDVAKQLIGHELQTNPDFLEEQILRSVEKVVSSKGTVQIYLNPQDFKQADYLEEAVSRVVDPSVRVIFMKDGSVDAGSCIINTQGGRLDARFSSQLELIRVVFEKYLGHKIDVLEDEPVEAVVEEPSNQEPLMVDEKDNLETKFAGITEPSDDDLTMLEDSPEDLIDLEIDDLDSLLQDVMSSDTDDEKATKAKPDEMMEQSLAELPLDDFADLDFSVDDDEDVESAKAAGDDLVFEEASEDGDESDENFEEFDEFAEDSDDEATDDRFPEY